MTQDTVDREVAVRHDDISEAPVVKMDREEVIDVASRGELLGHQVTCREVRDGSAFAVVPDKGSGHELRIECIFLERQSVVSLFPVAYEAESKLLAV